MQKPSSRNYRSDSENSRKASVVRAEQALGGHGMQRLGHRSLAKEFWILSSKCLEKPLEGF